MIVPLTRPASEFQLTRSPTLKLFIMITLVDARGGMRRKGLGENVAPICSRNQLGAAWIPPSNFISHVDAVSTMLAALPIMGGLDPRHMLAI
jgi:hypothetical protein